MRMFQILLVLCLTVLSATSADARICFLPASGTCGDYAIVPCDEKNTFKKESDCNAAVLSYVQVCKQTVKDGCWKKFCKYENKAACDKEADSLSSSSLHYSCSVDNDSGCYYLESTPCIAPSRDYHKACSGYTLNETEKTAKENSGWKCSSCEKSWTDYSCNSKGIVESTEGSETVYRCSKETNTTCYYTLTESEARDYENDGYKCDDCTPSTTTTDDQGNSTTVEGDTVYKCKKTTSTTCSADEYPIIAGSDEYNEKIAQGYSCESCCTPTTTSYEDGTSSDSNGLTVCKCTLECEPDQPTKAEDCTDSNTFYSPVNGKCGECLECTKDNIATKPNPCGQGLYCDPDKGLTGQGDLLCTACGDIKYYTTCMLAVTCTEGTNDGICEAVDDDDFKTYTTKKGRYEVKNKTCTKSDNTVLKFVALCNATGPDCMGEIPPAQGMQPCDTGFLDPSVTKKVSCGGKLYIPQQDMNDKKCLAQCDYDDTKEECEGRGGTFTAKCFTAANVTVGDCTVKRTD